MKPKSSHPSPSRLRRRQILVVGHGTSVVAFCSAFRSDWAEVTLVSDIPDHAPQVVRHGVAAGLLNREKVACSIADRFAAKASIQVRSGRMKHVDPEHRQLFLEGETKPFEFDYLLIGNQACEAIDAEVAFNSLAEAAQFHVRDVKGGESQTLHIVGSDPLAIDLAASFTHPAASRTPKVILKCQKGFDFANRTLKKKVEDRIAQHLRWESISLLDSETLDQVHNDALNIVPQRPAPPAWLTSQVTIDSNGYVGAPEVRPDLRLRAHERIYLFPELVQIGDSVGKTVPHDDNALCQQGRYLAKLLRGFIEVRKGYAIDHPGFVLGDSLRLATVRNWKSVGFIGQRSLPVHLSYLVDGIFLKAPVFRLIYGSFWGWMRLLQWLSRCK